MDCWYCLACISTDMCQQQLYCKTEVTRSQNKLISPIILHAHVCSKSINKYITHLFVFVHRHIKLYIHSWLFNILHVWYFINQHPIKLMVSVVNLALLCLSAPCCELKCVSALKCQARLCPFKRGYPDNHFYLILDLQSQVHMMQGFFFFTFFMPDTSSRHQRKRRQILLYIWQTYRSGLVLSLEIDPGCPASFLGIESAKMLIIAQFGVFIFLLGELES